MEQSEREILIWLLGLLSTDGSVTKKYTTKAGEERIMPWFRIATKELDWAELIVDNLSSIGIKAKIFKWTHHRRGDSYYSIVLKEPRKVLEKLRELNEWRFLSPRKFNLLQQVSPPSYHSWSKEEDEALLKLREEGLTWKEVEKKMKEIFQIKVGWQACRMRHARLTGKDWSHIH